MAIARIRTYTELQSYLTFEERLTYLSLKGIVGEQTFGFDRWINQYFYQRSNEWKSIRDYVIIRDSGCDLGIAGYDIPDRIYVHHMNPITVDDLKNNTDFLLNPEYLICTSFSTHQAIHYGKTDLIKMNTKDRFKNDTCPWKI